MPYVLSLALFVVGLVVLAVLLLRVYRALRRFEAAQSLVLAEVGEDAGVLGVRYSGVRAAGLRVLRGQRPTEVDDAPSPRTIG